MPGDQGEGWDVHTHLIPAALLTEETAERFGMDVRGERLRVRETTVPLGSITDHAALVRWIQRNQLEGAVVSPPPPLFRPDLAGGERRAWVALVNETLADACQSSSGCLTPLAYLPAEEPTLATKLVAELDDRWAGVTLGTDLAGRTYADPAYEPLFASLAERRLPAFVHPGHAPDPRLRSFYLTNLLGNAYETTLAAAHLVLGGVLDRHPTLQVILAHGGGAVAMLAGRWQRGHDTARPGLGKLEQQPLEAVRRLYVDTLVHSPAALDLLVAVLGREHLLLGTDWPFPMGADTAKAAMAGLSPELRHLARTDSPRRVFGERIRGPRKR